MSAKATIPGFKLTLKFFGLFSFFMPVFAAVYFFYLWIACALYSVSVLLCVCFLLFNFVLFRLFVGLHDTSSLVAVKCALQIMQIG